MSKHLLTLQEYQDSRQPNLFKIEILERLSNEDAEDFERLLPQLSSSAEFDYSRMVITILDKNTIVFVARNEIGRIDGSLTLAMYFLPTGSKAWIEDVVVESSARGQGVGKFLCQAAIEYARAEGFNKIDLTSKPARVAANEMYKSLGFKERQTNIYRMEI